MSDTKSLPAGALKHQNCSRSSKSHWDNGVEVESSVKSGMKCIMGISEWCCILQSTLYRYDRTICRQSVQRIRLCKWSLGGVEKEPWRKRVRKKVARAM